MPRSRRVLVLRTSRFTELAVDGARAKWPDADVRTASRPGPITPVSIFCSVWGWRLLAWRPDAVVMQWWNADGRGHEAARWAVFALGSRSRHAVLADGTWIDFSDDGALQRGGRHAWYALRGLALVVAVAVASAFTWPAAAWFRFRERRRLA